MKKLHFIVASFVLGLSIAASGYFIEQGLESRNLFNRYVSVKGLAEQTVKSDQAIWQLTIAYNANDLSAVYTGISSAQEAVKAFWIKQGFSAIDITLQPINVNDNSTYNSNHGLRYTATTSLILMSTEVDRIYSASQQMNALASNNILLNGSNITYSFTQLNHIKPNMLDDATSNAETAAQAFAKNSHSHLKGIRNASQGQFTISDDNNSGLSSITKKVRVVTSVEYFLKD